MPSLLRTPNCCDRGSRQGAILVVANPKPGWADGSPVIFDTNTIEDKDQNNRLDSRVVADKMKQLSASLMEILVLSESSDLVKKEIQRLKREMHRFRTDAKVAAIRSKIVDKVADKMAEQALTRSQARGDNDFDSEKFQPAALGELARELTTLVGVCGPAAVAMLARDSRKDMDERYHVRPDRESTGLVTQERFFAQLVNETVAAHEKSWFNGTKEKLFRLQIMSSYDQELVKGHWWASNGITFCATIYKVGLTLIYRPMYRLNIVAVNTEGAHYTYGRA